MTMANTDTWAVSGVLCDRMRYIRMLKQKKSTNIHQWQTKGEYLLTCQYIPNSMLAIRYVS